MFCASCPLRNSTVLRCIIVGLMLFFVLWELQNQRAGVRHQEAQFGHAIMDNAWTFSELLNETRKFTLQLYVHKAEQGDREDLALAFELLWSRVGALKFPELIESIGIQELERDYYRFLEEIEPQIFGDAPLTPEELRPMIETAESLAVRMRQTWSSLFTLNREQFFHLVSGALPGQQRTFELLIGLVVLVGVGYLALELVLSDLARRRERVLLAAANIASETKTAFLANMSHEIRTPLNGVIGAAELLRDTPIDKDQRRLLDTVSASAEHLLSIVNEVLDLAKIEAGRMDLEEQEIDLHGFFDQTIAMMRKAAEQKSIGLRLVISDELPGGLIGDPLRLRQVLLNLASNAVKFTERGEVVVSLEPAVDPDGGTRLLLKVRDTGIGIPPEKVEKVFEAFVQSDVSDTRRFGGTGLGLTISRNIVTLMQGTIEVTSELGAGTTVKVDLPLRAVAARAAPVSAPVQAPASQADRPDPLDIHLLIVEDNATNQMILQRMLRPLVASVELAVNGREAVERWKKGGIDLILMDIQMPEMTGTEAAAVIRGYEREWDRTPVPIYSLSANAMPHQVAMYTEAGMDGHLSKPFRKPELVEILHRHAHRRDMAPAA